MFRKNFPILILLFFCSLALQAQQLVLYGTNEYSYKFELLQHALSYHPEKKYQLVGFKNEIPKHRAFDFMNDRNAIDIIFGGATIYRESISLPVRIPILKGLNGWRMPIINKSKKDLFTTINSISSFKDLVPGQYYSWSDTKILESNGIEIAKGSDYEGLFQMLDKNRFDYFPRSVLEIENDYNARKHLNIMIDPTTLIHYPTAYYFFVAKENKTLHEDISFGLQQAIADKSFDKIFNKYYGEIIATIMNKNKKVFLLNNPLLPKQTPLSEKHLWVDLSQNSTIVH